MIYKCTTDCPILPDKASCCCAINTRKWTCNANLVPVWEPLMTHLCNSCVWAGDCPASDTEILYDNTSVVVCKHYEDNEEDDLL